MRHFAEQFMQQFGNVTEELASISKQRSNEQHHDPEIRNGFKTLHDIFSTLNTTIESSVNPQKEYNKYGLVNPVESKLIPSKCIHNQIKYGSSQILIKFIIRGLTNQTFHNKHQYVLQRLLNENIQTLCIQCIMELVIQTNKFQILMNFIKNICKHKTSPDTIYLSLLTFKLLNCILTQSKINRMFCKNLKNIQTIFHLFKYTSSNAGIVEISKMIRTSDNNDHRHLYFIFSGVLGVLFGTFKRKQFKIVAKMNILQYCCDIICSDMFCKKSVKICNEFELCNMFFVREFRLLFEIFQHKYRGLMNPKILQSILIKLQNWNCQTKMLSELLDGNLKMDSLNEINDFAGKPIQQNTLESAMFYRINTTLESSRISTSTCFNHKCKKHFRRNWNSSEWEFKLCSGCMIALYCNRKCQKYHWKYGHREQCTRFRTLK